MEALSFQYYKETLFIIYGTRYNPLFESSKVAEILGKDIGEYRLLTEEEVYKILKKYRNKKSRELKEWVLFISDQIRETDPEEVKRIERIIQQVADDIDRDNEPI